MTAKKYRVKAGKHVFGKDKFGKQITYKAGDIIVTEQDLLKHNAPGISKFEEVTEDLRKTRESELEELLRETKEQLKKVSSEANVAPPQAPTPAPAPVQQQAAQPQPSAEGAKSKK